MKPSICRTVVYNHPGSADGKFEPKQSPAIIQRVNEDGSCELFVMSVYGGIFFNHDVVESPIENPAPSTWSWPARIED